MGINVYSLFAELDSKQGLFETALALYDREVVANSFGALEAPGAGLREVVEVIEFFARWAGGPGAERGCLLCDTATERAPSDPSSKGFAEAYIERIQGAICQALENAKANGELRPEVSCGDQGRLLTSMLLGFCVLTRAGVDSDVVAGAARAACGALNACRVEGDRTGTKANQPRTRHGARQK